MRLATGGAQTVGEIGARPVRCAQTASSDDAPTTIAPCTSAASFAEAAGNTNV